MSFGAWKLSSDEEKINAISTAFPRSDNAVERWMVVMHSCEMACFPFVDVAAKATDSSSKWIAAGIQKIRRTAVVNFHFNGSLPKF